MLKRKAIVLVAAVLIVACAGCGGDDVDAGPDANPISEDFPPPPDGDGLQLFSTTRVEAGHEQLDCRYIALPDHAIDIGRFEHDFTSGAHHVLLYPTDLSPDEITDNGTFDCTSVGDLRQTGVAYGGSDPRGELPYPSGVAMRFPRSSVVLLESHYLNTTNDAFDAEVRVNLWYAEDPVDTEAGTIFFRNWAIYVPPAPAEASASMRCRLPQDISLPYATSHMHRRGTDFRSHLVRDGEDDMPLHDSQNWATPTPTVYWPALELRTGDIVDFSCDFQNDLTNAVVDGDSADTDEMCVFIGGYWPKMPTDAGLCLEDGSGPVLTGDTTCEQTVNCMLDAGVGNEVGGQQCILDTCAASAEALSSFVVCVERFDCWGNQSCVADNCLGQWNDCTLAQCD